MRAYRVTKLICCCKYCWCLLNDSNPRFFVATKRLIGRRLSSKLYTSQVNSTKKKRKKKKCPNQVSPGEGCMWHIVVLIKGESPSLSRCGRLTTIFKRQTVKISDGKVLHQAPNSSVISFCDQLCRYWERASGVVQKPYYFGSGSQTIWLLEVSLWICGWAPRMKNCFFLPGLQN